MDLAQASFETLDGLFMEAGGVFLDLEHSSIAE